MAGATILASLFANSIASADSFSDVKPTDWYATHVQTLVVAGILDGSRPIFGAGLHVTRDVAAKILVKALGYADADLIRPATPSFKDVSKSSWAYAYIETARSLGFVSGYGDGTYAPGRDVSRAEFASMIMRAFELEKHTGDVPYFTDVKLKSWFYDAVETVYYWSIVDGYDAQIFKPYNSINRAEMSKMITSAMHVSVRENLVAPYVPPAPVVPVAPLAPIVYVAPIPSGSSGGGSSGGGTSSPLVPVAPVAPIAPVVVVPPVQPVLPPAPIPTPTPTIFTETFSGLAAPHTTTDGETFGSWFTQFTGFGTVGTETDGSNPWLHLSPQIADAPDKTHASLVTGPSYTGALQFQSVVTTVAQLRTGSAPNAWEVAWVVWNYTDNEHFYYFIPKTNGWELGKRDPVYPGGQRFLATGSSPLFPIGQPYMVKITQDTSNTITVWVNGSQLTTFTDTERPYTSGKIGFYTEDAHIHVDDVSVTY